MSDALSAPTPGVDPAAVSGSSRASAVRPGKRPSGAAAVAASATLANALGALLTMVLAHTYTGSQFGALAALLGLGLIVTVPASGLQYVVARRTAAAALGDGVHDRTALRSAAVAGAGLALAMVLAAPLLAGFLAVPAAAVGLVGLTVPPSMLAAAQAGTLLARPRLTRFAGAQLLVAVLRFAAVVAACAAHADVTGVMLALALGTAAAVLCCLPLTGVRTWTARLPGGRGYAGELVRATVALAGASVVLNLDILLARHYLSARDSGVYALAALFAKAALWAAQFVPQLIFARLAGATGRGRLLLRAVAADLVVGAAVLLVAVLAARPLLALVAGTGEHRADPAAAAGLAARFAVLGTAWAVVLLVLLASVALRSTAAARMLWSVAALEAVAVAAYWHHSATEILAAVTAGTVLMAAAGVLLTARAAAPGPRAVAAAGAPAG